MQSPVMAKFRLEKQFSSSVPLVCLIEAAIREGSLPHHSTQKNIDSPLDLLDCRHVTIAESLLFPSGK